jgi:predicted HicB family RNase H-like nuclease
MSKALRYKGYTGSIEVSVEDGCLFGKIQFINDLVGYEGETVDELRQSFQSAVDGYLDTCKELGEEPEKPFKGSFNVRIGSELHREAAVAASQDGISLNEFVARGVKEAIERREQPARLSTSTSGQA